MLSGRSFIRGLVSVLLFTLTVLASCYVMVCLFALIFADRMIFPDFESSYKDNSAVLRLTISNDQTIAAVFLPVNPQAPTLLYSHGNGEDIGHIFPLLQQYRDFGFNVFAYDYPGYGTSDGKATEEGAYRAIRTSYNYVVNDLGVDPKTIIAYGRSVGSGPSVELAASYPLGGLILESPFTSAFDVFAAKRFLPWDKFDNYGKIDRVRVPLLIIHGTDDEIISMEHSRRLLEKANAPKSFLWVQNGGHNDLIRVAGETYWQTLVKFSKNVREHNISQTL